MAKKGILGALLVIVIGFSLIIIIPIWSISNNFSSYELIEAHPTYNYEPSTPSPIEHLFVSADVGNIEIKYVDPPVSYHASVEVDIEMSGVNLVEKSYEDYFNISWNTSDSIANFTLEVISENWYNPSLWITQDVSITVRIRKDIVFDITAEVTYGNLEISVPWGVSIHNIEVSITNGVILYDFDQCILEGNISARISKGELDLFSRDVACTQDIYWAFNNNGGDINLEIYQNEEMGANITGIGVTSFGNVNLTYIDDADYIGALFLFPFSDYFEDGVVRKQEGFNVDTPGERGFRLTSYDFGARNNYNLSFYITGFFIIDIES